MVDVNPKVPALEKLVDYAASGIGVVAGPMLAPWRARQEAKAKLIGVQAEADSLRLIADAQADARRSLAVPYDVGQGRPSAAERMSVTIPSIADGGVADADASHSRMS